MRARFAVVLPIALLAIAAAFGIRRAVFGYPEPSRAYVQLRPRDDGDVLEVLDGSMPLSICIETPWGTMVREFPEPWAAILWGVREGHRGEALRAEVARAWRRAVSQRELGAALVELGRAGVLRVHVG